MRLATILEEIGRKHRYATDDDIREVFGDYHNVLHWLAVLLIGDEKLADACIVDACTIAQTQAHLFHEWLVHWAARATVRCALQIQQARIAELAPEYEKGKPARQGRPPLSAEYFQVLVKNSELIHARLDVLCRFVLVLRGIGKDSSGYVANTLGVSQSAVERAYCVAFDTLDLISKKECQPSQGRSPDDQFAIGMQELETLQATPGTRRASIAPPRRSSSMPRVKSVIRFSSRFFAVFLGLTLLTVLVLRTGPQIIWNQVQTLGSGGMVLIIVLGGLAYLIRTWAWRLTFVCDISALRWSRSFVLCLVSEALGQLGLGGKVLGEGMRISLARSAVPLTDAIPSGAIDGGLHIATSAILTLSGIIATLALAPLSGRVRLLALIFAIALLAVLILVTVSVARQWELMGNAMRVIGRVPRFRNWISRKQTVITSSEHNLLNFARKAPAAFCAAFLLNFLWQAVAILEIYIILHFMGTKIAVLGAFVLEGLTKVIKLVGLLNPGNVGTYEGGNMLITKLFGVSGTVGLSLALCRRARALFWALIGAVCLMLMSKPNAQRHDGVNSDPTPGVVQM